MLNFDASAKQLGFPRWVKTDTIPDAALELRFTVPATPEQLTANEFDFSEYFARSFRSCTHSHDNDVLEIHGWDMRAVSADPIPLTTIIVLASMTMTPERKNVMDFIRELNELQGRYGLIIQPGTPILPLESCPNSGGTYMLMHHISGDKKVAISRVWGG